MAATTLGAWAADPTYKVKLTIDYANHEITGVDLTTPYTVTDDDIIATFCAANTSFNTVDYDITIGNITTTSSIYSIAVNAGDIIIEGPSTDVSTIDNVPITVKVKGQSEPVAGWNEQPISLYITVYHEQHTADASWETNATHHWHSCSNTSGKCDLTDYSQYPGYGEHTYGENPALESYYTCTLCGFVNNDRKPAHSHNYATAWTTNETNHWHECQNVVGICTAPKKDDAAHVYGTSQEGPAYYTCKVCGYVNSTKQSEGHTHDYSSDWTKDDTDHWHVCIATTGACNEPISDKIAHSYAAVDDPATTSLDERYTCSTCGYVDLARKAAIEANEANKNNPAWSWTYDIPFAFNATNVTNDRKLNALSANNKQQGYTVCLPYEITLPSTVEVYTLTASKDNQVGFVKTATNKLAPLTPYLIIPSISGQLLNAPDATIVETSQALVDANDVTSAAVSGQQQYTLKGSISYKSGDVAASETTKSYYILQGENKWGKLTGGNYLDVDNPACILPLRAYLVTDGTAPARLFSIFDEATGISREIVVDADSTPVIYDLQGRKVSNPQRGGLYIINGKKMIMK